MACWSIDCERKLPPSLSDAIVTLEIFLPVAVTLTLTVP